MLYKVIITKNWRKLEGFPESFLSVLTGVVKDEGNVLSNKYYKGSCDAAIILNKPAIKVIKAKVALYASYIISVSPVFNHTNLLRVYLNTVNFNNKS